MRRPGEGRSCEGRGAEGCQEPTGTTEEEDRLGRNVTRLAFTESSHNEVRTKARLSRFCRLSTSWNGGLLRVLSFEGKITLLKV